MTAALPDLRDQILRVGFAGNISGQRAGIELVFGNLDAFGEGFSVGYPTTRSKRRSSGNSTPASSCPRLST